MEPQASWANLTVEGNCEMSNLVPSPQSEAVTHEMEELTLQPKQNLPPLNERKNVLQLRLQQRRTREQLVDQGIIPPLKSPAAFHGQIRSLERARTENFLKHKIRSRPARAELVRMHILQETGAEPSLQATQMKLKRARLADDLNEKISQRPGPMELVEKNIIPVDSTLKQAIIVGQVNYPKVLDEDSNDALSPEQPASQESQGSVPSPVEIKGPEAAPPNTPIPIPDFIKVISTKELPVSRPSVPPVLPVITATPTKPGPTLVKQSHQKSPSEKSRSKKGKEPKSRVKKLKYHQYVPPDQKLEATEVPMDSSYARLLQQQQLFLQLQILSQQQQHYNYQTILPAPLKPVAESQNNSTSTLPTSIVVSLPTAPPLPPLPPAPARLNNSLSSRKPGVLPANLEEMKVAELKLELKLRSLPVSGTKTDLIERLKPFQDNPATSAHVTAAAPTTTSTLSTIPMEVTTATTTPAIILPVQHVVPENMSSTPPPVSPVPSNPSALQWDVGMSEAETHSAVLRSSPQPCFQVPEEKDRRLHEKQRQIEELMRKLEQEQKLVEELKMQLEVEKRGQGDCSFVSAVNTVKPAPSAPNSVLTSSLPTTLKLKDVTSQPGLQQFFISHTGGVSQVLGPPQTLLTTSAQTLLTTTGQAGTQILLPVSLPNTTTGIQLPSTTVNTHSLCQQTLTMCNNTATGLDNQSRAEVNSQCLLRNSPDNRVSPWASPNHHISNGPLSKSLSPQPAFILQHTSLITQPKSREPPRYEEAVKQTRNMHINSVSQVPTPTSQQMDDLFDILIESGEITPFVHQEPPSTHTKTVPVTANITTLPVNTVLSRPPPQIQMAPPPTLSSNNPSLSSLATDNQLEIFLEGTLANTPPASDPRTQGLMEELQAQLMEQHHYSPMDTSDLSLCGSSPPSLLHMGLSDPTLDNMEWLDLTMPPCPGSLTALGIPAEFLDAHELHWD
uniref:SAP domain-containing protein n=1 Tax=Gouania willdenowi TaxID=441366 RepID=A0A8C5N4S4_GOUWI